MRSNCSLCVPSRRNAVFASWKRERASALPLCGTSGVKVLRVCLPPQAITANSSMQTKIDLTARR
jgi:hypothetical protein